MLIEDGGSVLCFNVTINGKKVTNISSEIEEMKKAEVSYLRARKAENLDLNAMKEKDKLENQKRKEEMYTPYLIAVLLVSMIIVLISLIWIFRIIKPSLTTR